MPGSAGPHHSDKWHDCWDQVQDKGHDEASAAAICTASLERTDNVYDEKAAGATPDSHMGESFAPNPVPAAAVNKDAVAPEVTRYRQVEKTEDAKPLPKAPTAPIDSLSNAGAMSVPAPGEMNRRTSIPASLNSSPRSQATLERTIEQAPSVVIPRTTGGY